MKRLCSAKLVSIFGCIILCALFTIDLPAAQEASDEVLKKKYELILGDFEFDMSDFGGGTFIINYYVEKGHLWADSGDGRPAIMQPVKDKTLAFKADDPEAGAFHISFEKDENGAYTKSRIYIEQEGIEIVGQKVK